MSSTNKACKSLREQNGGTMGVMTHKTEVYANTMVPHNVREDHSDPIAVWVRSHHKKARIPQTDRRTFALVYHVIALPAVRWGCGAHPGWIWSLRPPSLRGASCCPRRRPASGWWGQGVAGMGQRWLSRTGEPSRARGPGRSWRLYQETTPIWSHRFWLFFHPQKKDPPD